MESNELTRLLDEIQFKSKKSLEEIAKDIGYSRPYLNAIKYNQDSSHDKVIGKLKESYKEILQKNTGSVSADLIIQAIIKLAENQDKIINTNSEAVATNKILAEANLLLSKRLSSSDIGLTSSPYQGEGNNQQHGIEQDRPLPAPPSGKKESHSRVKSGKQKDSGSVRNK